MGKGHVSKGVVRTTRKRWDGKTEEIAKTTFFGCDGRIYRIVMEGNAVYVNGAKMLNWIDQPCEYTGKCKGSNDDCSYHVRKLDGPEDERCELYNERKREELHRTVQAAFNR
jgi:hypothetical protein